MIERARDRASEPWSGQHVKKGPRLGGAGALPEGPSSGMQLLGGEEGSPHLTHILRRPFPVVNSSVLAHWPLPWTTALVQHLRSHVLLLGRSVGGQARSSHTLPGGDGELVRAVVTVARIRGVVPPALALGDRGQVA